MILVKSTFYCHHALTLTIDLLQGQIRWRAGDHNSSNFLVSYYDLRYTLIYSSSAFKTPNQHYFRSERFAIFVHINFKTSFVCPSVCLAFHYKRFNLAHIVWSINGRAIIFGMNDPWNMSFQLTPCCDLDLWPTSRSNIVAARGLQFSEYACKV